MAKDPHPNSEQMKRLGGFIQQAFVDLRYIEGDQAHDLAYAFHNIPAEIFGWGTWNVSGTRKRLKYYQSKYPDTHGFDYVSSFDSIFEIDA